MNTDKVNRLEIIDNTKSYEDGGGRMFVKWEDKPLNLDLQMQNDDKTLKIFLR